MREVEDLIRRAAGSTATVLIRGESGTGKELAARAIHDNSPRRNAPFVKIHCAALPDTLIESELFGYEKGAFTGAASRKPGRVELAEGGTLFLDEIGDVTPVIQVKLLRLLQDREFERLGGTQTLKSTARFVAATHQPLEELIKKRAFREDLFYRLNVVPIWIPALRARAGDVESLARHFCRQFGEANGRGPLELEPDALALLQQQPGRATCASCRTSSSGWWCCPTATRSPPPTSSGSWRGGRRWSPPPTRPRARARPPTRAPARERWRRAGATPSGKRSSPPSTNPGTTGRRPRACSGSAAAACTIS